MTDIHRINDHFYLREEPLEVGEARDLPHAKLFANADKLRDMVRRMIPLVPNFHPIADEAQKLLESLQ